MSGKPGHRCGPTLGHPIAMAAQVQPRMPAVAREEGQAVFAQGLTAMGAPLRP